MREAETDALVGALQGNRLVASSLVLAELTRAVGRRGLDPQAPQVLGVLRALALVDTSRAALADAGRLRPAGLRTLDAVHLAAALAVRTALDAVVVYDDRLRAAAREHGLRTLSPGARLP